MILSANTLADCAFEAKESNEKTKIAKYLFIPVYSF
jgi:hypothetical protein